MPLANNTHTRFLQVATDKVESSIQDQTLGQEINQVVQVAEIAGGEEYAAPPMPGGVSKSASWNTTLGSHVAEADAVTGHQYYPIVRGPFKLTPTTLADARYVDGIPGFPDGAALCVSLALIHTHSLSLSLSFCPSARRRLQV